MKPFNHIVLVEDNPIDVFINSKVIEQANLGEVIQSFPSGRPALDYLKDSNVKNLALPELIILDIRMPDMDGFEFLDEFNQFPDSITEQIKILMLSSSIDPDDESKAKSYPHIVDYICKPLTRDKLLSINFTH